MPKPVKVYQALLPSLSEYYTQLGQHTALYQTYQQIHDSAVFQTLSEAQQSAIKLALRDFKLSGVALEGEAKNVMQKFSTFITIVFRLLEPCTRCNQAYFKPLTEEQLKGLPQSSVELLKQYGQQRELEQAVATLDFPAYFAIMTYADDRELREELYKAYVTVHLNNPTRLNLIIPCDGRNPELTSRNGATAWLQ
jgi:oligopeptidase A